MTDRLVNCKLGDAASELANLPDNSVDLVLVDPPYDFKDEVKEQYLQEFSRVSRTGCVIFAPPENLWGQSDQYLFWCKPISTKNTSKRYSRFVEVVQIFGQVKWNSDRHWSNYTNIFTDTVVEKMYHPFQKPVSLLEKLILNHTDEGDLVLDCFMGSGSVGVACRRTNRRYFGVENCEGYFKVAKARLDVY